VASALMTVKIVVPTCGRRETTAGVTGVADGAFIVCRAFGSIR